MRKSLVRQIVVAALTSSMILMRSVIISAIVCLLDLSAEARLAEGKCS
jgi:hypothetical protein